MIGIKRITSIENKILYQMHFLVFDLKIPWRNILRIIKKNSGGISANSGPEFRLLVIPDFLIKIIKNFIFLNQNINNLLLRIYYISLK